jgi:hypothetical protein
MTIRVTKSREAKCDVVAKDEVRNKEQMPMSMSENDFSESGNSPPVKPEPFVSADEAAQFLSVSRRYLLALARRGLAGGYDLGTGTQRKTWVFRLSELAKAIAEPSTLTPKSQKCITMRSGSLHAGKRSQ